MKAGQACPGLVPSPGPAMAPTGSGPPLPPPPLGPSSPTAPAAESLPGVRVSLRTILQNFLQHVERLESESPSPTEASTYEKEFAQLKLASEGLKQLPEFACAQGELEVNRKKNRYKDILPFDETRVWLSEYPGVPGSDYINANYIKGASGSNAYIAAQGPLPHTVNDFWRMVVEAEVQVIVMACNETEAGKHKCERYWNDPGGEGPEAGSPEEPRVELSAAPPRQFGKFSVQTLKRREICPDFSVRTMRLRWTSDRGPEEERTVCQFHYSAWPDHGIPTQVKPLLEMVRLIRDCQASETLPVLIHCSAGCGRTGTICAIDFIWGLLRTGKLTNEFSLYGLVRDMRKQRVAMVQTVDQYILVHRAVRELFLEQLRVIDSHPYENVDDDGNPLGRKSLLAQAREDVSSLSTPYEVPDYETIYVNQAPDTTKESALEPQKQPKTVMGTSMLVALDKSRDVIDPAPPVPPPKQKRQIDSKAIEAKAISLPPTSVESYKPVDEILTRGHVAEDPKSSSSLLDPAQPPEDSKDGAAQRFRKGNLRLTKTDNGGWKLQEVEDAHPDDQSVGSSSSLESPPLANRREKPEASTHGAPVATPLVVNMPPKPEGPKTETRGIRSKKKPRNEDQSRHKGQKKELIRKPSIKKLRAFFHRDKTDKAPATMSSNSRHHHHYSGSGEDSPSSHSSDLDVESGPFKTVKPYPDPNRGGQTEVVLVQDGTPNPESVRAPSRSVPSSLDRRVGRAKDAGMEPPMPLHPGQHRHGLTDKGALPMRLKPAKSIERLVQSSSSSSEQCKKKPLLPIKRSKSMKVLAKEHPSGSESLPIYRAVSTSNLFRGLREILSLAPSSGTTREDKLPSSGTTREDKLPSSGTTREDKLPTSLIPSTVLECSWKYPLPEPSHSRLMETSTNSGGPNSLESTRREVDEKRMPAGIGSGSRNASPSMAAGPFQGLNLSDRKEKQLPQSEASAHSRLFSEPKSLMNLNSKSSEGVSPSESLLSKKRFAKQSRDKTDSSSTASKSPSTRMGIAPGQVKPVEVSWNKPSSSPSFASKATSVGQPKLAHSSGNESYGVGIRTRERRNSFREAVNKGQAPVLPPSHGTPAEAPLESYESIWLVGQDRSQKSSAPQCDTAQPDYASEPAYVNAYVHHSNQKAEPQKPPSPQRQPQQPHYVDGRRPSQGRLVGNSSSSSPGGHTHRSDDGQSGQEERQLKHSSQPVILTGPPHHPSMPYISNMTPVGSGLGNGYENVAMWKDSFARHASVQESGYEPVAFIHGLGCTKPPYTNDDPNSPAKPREHRSVGPRGGPSIPHSQSRSLLQSEPSSKLQSVGLVSQAMHKNPTLSGNGNTYRVTKAKGPPPPYIEPPSPQRLKSSLHSAPNLLLLQQGSSGSNSSTPTPQTTTNSPNGRNRPLSSTSHPANPLGDAMNLDHRQPPRLRNSAYANMPPDPGSSSRDRLMAGQPVLGGRKSLQNQAADCVVLNRSSSRSLTDINQTPAVSKLPQAYSPQRGERESNKVSPTFGSGSRPSGKGTLVGVISGAAANIRSMFSQMAHQPHSGGGGHSGSVAEPDPGRAIHSHDARASSSSSSLITGTPIGCDDRGGFEQTSQSIPITVPGADVNNTVEYDYPNRLVVRPIGPRQREDSNYATRGQSYF